MRQYLFRVSVSSSFSACAYACYGDLDDNMFPGDAIAMYILQACRSVLPFRAVSSSPCAIYTHVVQSFREA